MRATSRRPSPNCAGARPCWSLPHRLNTIRHADEILVIDQGRIVQAGAHDTLMEEEGIYRRFITARSNPTSWCR